MKKLSDIAESLMPNGSEKMINALYQPFGIKYLETPILASEAICSICSGSRGMSCLVDPISSDDVAWFCIEPHCMALVRESKPKPSLPTSHVKRSILWPSWCELNGIGDLCGKGVKFEDINQSEGKIQYLKKFASSPTGIIIMQGSPGSGKTYAALATCELFTRTNSSCLFFTQKQMIDQWASSFQSDKPWVFKDKCCRMSVLIVDDFGLCEPPPKFLDFFIDIINTRMQWSNRGTIITTNLDEKKLSEFCGASLMDRLNTGQPFIFSNQSRRKPPL